MKFELNCMATDLRQALAIASSVTDSGVKVPVLKAVRIEVSGKTATFIATNTDHAIRADVGAEGEGTVHLETALLIQKAAALRQDQPVRLSGDDAFITITQGKTRWRLPVIIGDGFPFEFTAPVEGKPVSVRRDVLFAAISSAHVIVNPADPHPTIGKGVYLDMSDGFRVVGAARWGLSVVQIDEPALPIDIILPSNAIRAMIAIFRDNDTVDIVATENAITMRGGSVMYKTKLIEGKYPDWRKVRDSQNVGLTSSALVYAEHFIDAIKRATAIAEDKTKSNTGDGIRVTMADGECSMLIKNRSGEEGFDTCEFEGDDGYFTISASLLASAFETMSGTRLRVDFHPDPDPMTPSAVLVEQEPKPERDNFRMVMGMLVQ